MPLGNELFTHWVNIWSVYQLEWTVSHRSISWRKDRGEQGKDVVEPWYQKGREPCAGRWKQKAQSPARRWAEGSCRAPGLGRRPESPMLRSRREQETEPPSETPCMLGSRGWSLEPGKETGLLLVHSQVTARRIKLGMRPLLPLMLLCCYWSFQIHSEFARSGELPPAGATKSEHPFFSKSSRVFSRRWSY